MTKPQQVERTAKTVERKRKAVGIVPWGAVRRNEKAVNIKKINVKYNDFNNF